MTRPAEQHGTVVRIPAYLFDLLEPAERAAFERSVAASAELEGALSGLRRLVPRWANEVDVHPGEGELTGLLEGGLGGDASARLLSHVLDCRDCRFELAVLAAEAEARAEAGEGAARPTRSRKGQPWVWAGVASGLAAGLLLGLFLWAPAERPDPGGTHRFERIELQTLRGSSKTIGIELSELEDGVAFRVEARLPSEEIVWRIVRGGAVVAEGRRSFDAGSPALRSFDVVVPRDVLVPDNYDLVVVGADGSDERRWSFHVQP